jgi:hypothetical protein
MITPISEEMTGLQGPETPALQGKDAEAAHPGE